jgi:hypothetical protein
MKVFVMGLDGLEYNFVEDWNLTNLMQKEHGKVRVPINEKRGIPLTPEVWASFLVGEHINKDFSESLYLHQSPSFFGNQLVNLLKFLRGHLPFGIGLEIALFTRRFPKLQEKTFLDLCKSKAVNVPYYNYDNQVWNTTALWSKNKVSLQQGVKVLRRIYAKRKRQMLREIQNVGDAELFFGYMHFPDVMNHYLFIRPSQLRRHYEDLNDFIPALKQHIADFLFLIVSDHGFNFTTETHSMHGFYSSNIPLNLNKPSITDFHQLITNKILHTQIYD